MRPTAADRTQSNILRNSLFAERSSITREAIARKLGSVGGFEDLDEVLRIVGLPGTASLLEVGVETVSGSAPPNAPALVVLFAVCGPAPLETVASALPEISEAFSFGLAEAIRNGLDRTIPLGLAYISYHRLHEITALFSPFDEGGLGTCDALQCIARIDQMYLLFRQILYFMENDLLPSGT